MHALRCIHWPLVLLSLQRVTAPYGAQPLPLVDRRGERVIDEWRAPPVKPTGPPAVLSISPSGAAADGNITVIISGESFRDYGDVKCRFCSIEVRGYVVHNGAITCEVPPVSALPLRMEGQAITLPTSCAVDVTFNGVDYTKNSKAVFTYYNLSAIAIATMHPSGGPTAGGTVVNLRGINFADYGGGVQGLKCRFGSSVVSATMVSQRTVRCLSPPTPSSAGVALPSFVPVYLTLNGYTDQRSLSGSVHFRYANPPTVSDLRPHGGPTTGGQQITVFGGGFTDNSIVRRPCDSGDAMPYACELHRIASGVLRTDTPIPGVQCVFEGSSDDGHATTLTSPGTLHGGDGNELTCEVPPRAAELARPLGPWCAHLGNNRYCNDTAYVDSAIKGILLRVTLNGNTSDSSLTALTYLMLPSSLPRLFYITPWGGPPAGGTQVQIVGQELLALGVRPVCRFGNIETPGTVGGMNNSLAIENAPLVTQTDLHDSRVTRVLSVQTGKLMSCRTPPGLTFGSRWVRVGVSLDGDHFSSDTVAFRYTQFAVSSVHPSGGPLRGGTRVLLSGLGFSDFGGVQCVFGTQSVQATLLDSRNVWCITPPSTQGNRSVSLSLSVNGDLSSASLEHGNVTFAYFDDSAVMISSLTPALGPVLGGVEVTLRGTGFADFGTVQCRFGDLPPVNATHTANAVSVDNVTEGGAEHDLHQLVCHLPPLDLRGALLESVGSKLVTVQVSLNGADFSPHGTDFLYHHPCHRHKDFALDYPTEEAQKAVMHYLNLNWPNLSHFDTGADGLDRDEIRKAIEYLANNATAQADQHLPEATVLEAYQADTCFLKEQPGNRQLSRADDTTAADETGGFVPGGPTRPENE